VIKMRRILHAKIDPGFIEPNSVYSPVGISSMLKWKPTGLGRMEAVKRLRVKLFQKIVSSDGMSRFCKDGLMGRSGLGTG
jgi:hypothetical protein